MVAKSTGELEIGILPPRGGSYEVELRLTDPDSHVQRAPVRGPAALDEEALRTTQADMEAYGRLLTAQLFHDPSVREFYRETRAVFERDGRPLRIQVAIDRTVMHLDALRWELLRDLRDTPLATSESTYLSRLIHSRSWRQLRLMPRAPLKAVVAVAAPVDCAEWQNLDEIDLHDQLQRATQALAGIAVSVVGDSHPCTLERLVDAIRSGPDIVYLVCHGAIRERGPILYLQDDAGKVAPILASEFAARLEEPVSVRIVVAS